MSTNTLFLLCLAAPLASPLSFPPLPSLHLDRNTVTISGISSGADLAALAAVALSDLISGAAIFAGAPWQCATVLFPGEPQFPCSAQAGGSPGPGCPGGGFPGSAPCLGCSPSLTLSYDHCKHTSNNSAPSLVSAPLLASLARSAAAAGLIPSTAHLGRTRVLGFRGDLDTCYLPGSVNKTMQFFSAFAASPEEQVRFVTGWPMQHALPTIDPAVSPATCGRNGVGPPAMANCGYDGAGESLRHMYGSTVALTPPASHACDASCAAQLLSFDQAPYIPSDWHGAELSSQGWLYVPKACAAGAAPPSPPCRLHVSLHGCGMSMWSPAMGMNYTLHSGYNVWGEANNIVRERQWHLLVLQRSTAQHSHHAHTLRLSPSATGHTLPSEWRVLAAGRGEASPQRPTWSWVL